MSHVNGRTVVMVLIVLGLFAGGRLAAHGHAQPAPVRTLAAPAPPDPAQIQQGQIEKLQAEIKALQDSIKALELQLKGAAEELDRAKRAKPSPPKPGATQAEQEKYNHQLSAWQARVDAAQQKVDTLKGEIEAKRAQLQVKQMQLRKLLEAQRNRRPGKSPAA